MKPIRFAIPVLLTAGADNPRRFNILAYTGGPLHVGGFPLPVVIDLAGLEVPQSIPILADHVNAIESTIGHTEAIQNDGRSLVLSGPITTPPPQPGVPLTPAQQVVARIGQRWQASVGTMVTRQEQIGDGQTVVVNGQQFRGPLIVARQSRLAETSILAMGADSSTQVTLVAKAAPNGVEAMTFEEWCSGQGIDPAKLGESAKSALMQAYDAEVNGGHGAPAASQAAAFAVLNLRAASANEHRRIAAINAIAAKNPMIAAKAIEAGWSVAEAELAMLRASHSPAPRNFAGSPDAYDVNQPQVLSASLMLRCSNETLALKAYGERTVEAARRHRITNLVDLAAAALRASGHDPHAYANRDQMLQAAISTQSLSNVLADTVGRTLDQAYQETTSDWRKFCNVASAEDFRTQTGIRPGAITNLDEVARGGGKIKHAAIKEEATYSWSVKTYSRMVSVDRYTLVNDDLGFIAQLSPALGQAAGRSLLDLIWSTIMGGETAGFFSVGNSNLLTSNAVLSVSSLGLAVAAMRSQTDSNGYNLDLSPAALAVPPSLELSARNLLNSALLAGSSTTDVLVPSGNPVAGIVPQLVIEPRLGNSRLTGSDIAAWYLFGPPSAKAVTVGFLQSQQSPTVEVNDAPFDQLGTEMRVVFDYGCALSDPKGAYKANPA